jgi:DNA-binding CsgD family transcriptional regulator
MTEHHSNGSRDQVALVRSYMDAFEHGSPESMLRLLDRDCTIIPSYHWSPRGVWYFGHEGARACFEHIGLTDRRFRVDAEVGEAGHRVLVRGAITADGDTRKPGAWIFDVAGGRIRRVQGFKSEQEAVAKAGALTARQREIFELLARGLNGPEAADRLLLSPATVRTHIANALDALDAHTQGQAIAEAIRRGEIHP